MDISCQRCQVVLRVDEKRVGTEIRCPSCQHVFICSDSTTDGREDIDDLLLQLAEEEATAERLKQDGPRHSILPRTPILVTTETVIYPGCSIGKMLSMISSRRVFGMNLIKDVSMSITDVIGGRSTAAEKGFAELETAVLQEIRNTAKRMGAHAVVGVRVQIGELPGGGTKILFAAAQGTPVILVASGS